MRARLKQLGKDSLIYGLGGIAARSVSFFLLPVYTRLFTPAEYGTIEMLTVLNGFLAFVLVMGMDSAQSFFFFEQKANGRPAQAAVVSAILHWRLFWGTALVALATLLAPLLNYFFFDGRLTWEYFAIAFAGGLFAQLLSQSAEVFRLLYRPWGYIAIILGQTLLAAAASLALIVWGGYGIRGYFLGFLLASLLVALAGWWLVRDYWEWRRPHREWWPRLLRFGAPLVPAGLAMYVLNTADRWFVSHYSGHEALGLYAVGAKFAMLLAVGVTTFRQAWWPVAMDAMHSADGPPLFRAMGRMYLGCGSAAVVLLTWLSPWLIGWLAAPAYFPAYPLIGVLAWSSLFYGFYLIGASGIWKAERTIWSAVLTGIVAVLNLLLAALLVPRWGGMGAALATSGSFLVWNILALLVSERLWRVGYPLMVLALQVGLGVAATAYILNSYAARVDLLALLPLALLAAVAILASGASSHHWAAGRRLLTGYFRK